MSKTCVSRPLNGCAASLCWFYSPLCLSTTSTRLGRHKPSSGCAVLGGKLCLSTDADGPYVLLTGISAVLLALTSIRYDHHHPIPRPRETYR